MLGPARYEREGYEYGIDAPLLPTLSNVRKSRNSVLKGARDSHASSKLIYSDACALGQVGWVGSWHDVVFVTITSLPQAHCPQCALCTVLILTPL